jgi:inorganic phosphate transporter, PiT family
MDNILLYVVILTIAAAFIFDVINGFHDAANSIATIVSTKVLSPKYAVIWAAFFNILAMFIFAPKVANTIAKIIAIDPADHAFIYVIFSGLLGAIIWDLLTWWWGLPTSSSHALIGGLAGAGIAYKGTAIINWYKVTETMAFIPLAPIIGLVLAFIIMLSVYWAFRRFRPHSVDKIFRKGQLFSAALYSLGHGGNDAQKTMGIIVAVLVAYGTFSPDKTLHMDDPSSLLIISGCYIAMGIGTAMGGWRIVKTMGMKLTKLKPVHGFCAESAGALTLYLATHLGIPVSTTHTIAGSIVGVGLTGNISGIKWKIASRIVISWVVTIPFAGIVAALTFWFIQLIHNGF